MTILDSHDKSRHFTYTAFLYGRALFSPRDGFSDARRPHFEAELLALFTRAMASRKQLARQMAGRTRRRVPISI